LIVKVAGFAVTPEGSDGKVTLTGTPHDKAMSVRFALLFFGSLSCSEVGLVMRPIPDGTTNVLVYRGERPPEAR
jgi:hypothetical protein